MCAFRFIAGIVVLLLAGTTAAQQQLRCASRNFQYQYCPAGDVRGAALIQQYSRSPCIEGQSWGADRRGLWVSNGCDGLFNVTSPGPFPPPGPGANVSCDSRDYRYEFCYVAPRVLRADLVRQKSQTPCVLGRNWGWRGDGVWVNEGCAADFVVRTDYGPVPTPGPGLVHCESSGYRYNFCATGPIRDAQLVEQTSRAQCIRGSTWGTQRDGIWVDNGCEGRFRVTRRGR
jgi:hypothetical protein